MADEPVFARDAYVGETFADLEAEEAVFDGIEFEDCHFRRCRFPSSTFRSCLFVNCLFEACDLSLLKVPASRFTSAQFTDCKLIGVDWCEASSLTGLTTSMSFQRCVLSYGFFVKLDLTGAQIVECQAHEVDFTGATLQRVSFVKCDLEGAKFLETDLREADFTGAYGYIIDPTRNKVKKARFSLPEAIGLLKAFGVVVMLPGE
jgi:fluoroquinolone resistance protein